MIYRIKHRTFYEYEVPVPESHHTARLEPRVTATQQREQFSLEIRPEPAVRKRRVDYFGNHVCFFSIQELHSQLEIVATSRVTVVAGAMLEPKLSPPWEEVRAQFSDPVSPDVVEPFQFALDSPLTRVTPELQAYAAPSFPSGTPLLVGVMDLNRRIHADFKFDPVATTISTPLDEVMQKRQGVCQDFAHLEIACLRSLGLPARYVSGYLRTRPPEGKEKLVGADHSHAWVSAFCPVHGWVDFDPTNNVLPSQEHIVVAYGRDFNDISPLCGILTGGGEHELQVGVDVEPV